MEQENSQISQNTENTTKSEVGYGKPPKDKQWKKGQSGNPGGRPKGTLKEYVKQKFIEMDEKEKEKFLKSVAPELIWQMGEGKPKQDMELSGEVTSKIIKLDE